MVGELAVANAGARQLLAALLRKLWAKKAIRVLFSIYGSVGLGVALSYLMAKKKQIKGKTVLVTGGAGGLGRCIAEEVARRGAKRVILWDIDEAVAKTAQEMRAAYQKTDVSHQIVDVSKRDCIYKEADQLHKEVDFVDIVINNAGILGGKPFTQLDDGRIEKLFAVNTLAHFWTTKKFLPPMMKRKEGHIVNVASAAAYFPTANATDYCASKSAAKAFIDALRLEMKCYGQKGVKTLCVCPAGMNTALFKGQKSVPGLPVMNPKDVAVQTVDAIESQRETLITPWPFPHMGIMNFAMMPVWFSDFCSTGSNDTITSVDLTQANSIFERMEK